MPPVAVTVTVEVLLPQVTGVALATALRAAGSLIDTEVDAEQLPASVTVNVYVPAVLLNVPVPVYGGVPPDALIVTEDVPPLQLMGVAFADTVRVGGALMVTEREAEQLLASVTVNVYVPAVLLNVPVPL